VHENVAFGAQVNGRAGKLDDIVECALRQAALWDEVRDFVSGLPGVVSALDYKFTCSEPGQLQIKETVEKERLNRVVVAACSPRMHESTFRKAIAEAGLNPYLLQIANIREQGSWVHKDGATEKAKAPSGKPGCSRVHASACPASPGMPPAVRSLR
jgi:heterodisulfide reductase subunit A